MYGGFGKMIIIGWFCCIKVFFCGYVIVVVICYDWWEKFFENFGIGVFVVLVFGVFYCEIFEFGCEMVDIM